MFDTVTALVLHTLGSHSNEHPQVTDPVYRHYYIPLAP